MQEICCKCQKFPVKNKTYMLCQICNFERLHPDMMYSKFTRKKIKEYRERRVVKMKPLSSSTFSGVKKRKCAIVGCTKDMKFSAQGGLCKYHWAVWRKNEKIKLSKKSTINKPQITEGTVKSRLSIIKRKAKENHGNMCEGCLKNYSGLDYSHILSVAQRKDLELHEENKNLLCRSCHIKWESNNESMLSLACFYDNMIFIRKHDIERFWKIYFIFNDRMNFEVCKKIELIDEEYKNNNE